VGRKTPADNEIKTSDVSTVAASGPSFCSREQLRGAAALRHYRITVFDWSLDPKSQLAMLCLLSAFVCWNNNTLFFLFSAMAVFSRVLD
jgi:hypothetical protein